MLGVQELLVHPYCGMALLFADKKKQGAEKMKKKMNFSTAARTRRRRTQNKWRNYEPTLLIVHLSRSALFFTCYSRRRDPQTTVYQKLSPSNTRSTLAKYDVFCFFCAPEQESPRPRNPLHGPVPMITVSSTTLTSNFRTTAWYKLYQVCTEVFVLMLPAS